MDVVFGQFLSYLARTGLDKSTYVFVMSDNGGQLMEGEDHQTRMPSRMQGFKHSAQEGGVRNWLAVRGPGVRSGVVETTLTDIVDILPTMAALAGLDSSAVPHGAWDGISLANLLLGERGAGSPGASTVTSSYAPTGDAGVGSNAEAVQGSGTTQDTIITGGSDTTQDTIITGGSDTSDGGSHTTDVGADDPASPFATPEQRDRYVFSLSAHCWNSNAVPLLTRDTYATSPTVLLPSC
jgi:hypothetical protein